jgi:hypothetical protein
VAAVDAVIIDRLVFRDVSRLGCHGIGAFFDAVASFCQLAVEHGEMVLADFAQFHIRSVTSITLQFFVPVTEK